MWLKTFFFKLLKELTPVVEVLLTIKFPLDYYVLFDPNNDGLFWQFEIFSLHSD